MSHYTVGGNGSDLGSSWGRGAGNSWLVSRLTCGWTTVLPWGLQPTVVASPGVLLSAPKRPQPSLLHIQGTQLAPVLNQRWQF